MVLLIGIHDDTLIFHDPWKGPDLTMQVDAFNDVFNWDREDGLLFLTGSKRATYL